MGRSQSKTLPNRGEFLIGRLWEKRNCIPNGAAAFE